MMSVRSRLWILTLLLIIAWAPAPAAYAGTYEQAFVDSLAKRSPSETIVGIITLGEQPDIPALERAILTRGLKTRAARHRFVVESAIAIAERSQRELIAQLAIWKAEGRVTAYRPYWVMNAIAVEAAAPVFEAIVVRPEIGTIYDNRKAQLRTGWESPGRSRARGARDLPDNLVCVNLQSAWDLGFRGQGRLVCTLDSGADGAHEALASQWRGLVEGVNWWEAWKDPYTGTSFPYDGRTSGHGTHVMGIIVGEMPDGTPIGVAPEAWWMAAGATIEWDFDKIIECYQWATDPDGDPGTIDDVPDVINNSWGTSADCDDTFWNAIDLVEAAGIVNTIAVDNRGPNPMTVNSPESRAASATVNWGVGNVDPHDPAYPISITSGRGPSPCDSVSIKPEVTAPGTVIYSTLPGDTYGTKTGTSMACPHTSGAVALMRQVDPDLTVEEIKLILMGTAVDKGTPGEDNDYGWGIIDIAAAVDSVRQLLPRNRPTDLTTAVHADSVTLQWSRPDTVHVNNPLLRYRVFRSPVGDSLGGLPIAEVADTAATVTYLDPSLPYDEYHYAVSALYAVGESEISDEAFAAVFPNRPPRNLTATVVVDTVSLEWERPDTIHVENPLSLYRIFRAPLNEPFGIDPIVELSDTSAVVGYADTILVAGDYHYEVTAVYLYNVSDPSNEAEATVFPYEPPRNLSAAVFSDSVSLTWERPEPIDPGNPVESYRLYRAPLGEPLGVVPIGEVVDTSAVAAYVDSGVPFAAHHYAARAVYAAAESDTSNHVVITEASWTTPPHGLAVAVVADTANLSWQRPVAVHPNNPLLRYRLFRALLGEPFGAEPIAEVESDLATIAYSDSGVPFADHHYAVTALYASAESDTSDSVVLEESVWMQPPAELIDSVSVDTVRLEWERPVPLHPDNPVELYRIFRGPLGQPLGTEPIAELPDTSAVPAYADTDVPAGTYEYAVTALYTPAESDTSGHVVASVYPYSPPRNLVVSASADTARLVWDRPDPLHPDNPVLLYRIYRAPQGEPFPETPTAVIDGALDAPAYSDSGVPYESLTYAVSALYASAESDTSNHALLAIEVWTQPPGDLAAVVAADSVRLEWDRPDPTHPDDPLQSYRLYRAVLGEPFGPDPIATIIDSSALVVYFDLAVPLDSLAYAVTALYTSAESDTSNHVVLLEEMWRSPPENLAATVSADTVQVEWDRPVPVHPGDPLQEYRLYRSRLGEPFGIDPIAVILDAQDRIAYVDSGVPFDSLQYAVTALYQSAESDTSHHLNLLEEIWITAPTDLSASVAADTVNVEWFRPAPIHPENTLLSYRLYRALEEDPFGVDPLAEIVDSLGVISFLDAGVPYDTYHYVVTAVYPVAESPYSNEVVAIVFDPAAIDEPSGRTALWLGIAPNPFNPIAAIRYQAIGSAPLSVAIYDVRGARVRTLVHSESASPGLSMITWNGTDDAGRPVPSGAYFIRVEQAGQAVHRRIVLLK